MAPINKENCIPNSERDMLWVPQKEFEIIKAKLAKGALIANDEVDVLVNPTPKDSDRFIPIDMNGAGENLDDFDHVLDKLGAKAVAQCFMKAHAHFESSKNSIPIPERPKPITGKEYKNKYLEASSEEEEKPLYFPDLFHVPKSVFEAVQQKLNTGASLTAMEVDRLVNFEAQDSETYVPVDMNGADEDLDEFEEALAKLGPRKTAECFVQAYRRFQAKKHLLPADKQKELSAKEWKNETQEDEEEEKDNFDDDDEEESSDQENDEEEQPPNKKTRRA